MDWTIGRFLFKNENEKKNSTIGQIDLGFARMDSILNMVHGWLMMSTHKMKLILIEQAIDCVFLELSAMRSHTRLPCTCLLRSYKRINAALFRVQHHELLAGRSSPSLDVMREVENLQTSSEFIDLI